LLTEERLLSIRALLEERGAVHVGELMLRLGASRETVRRDLAELERLGVLRRVHGGAVSLGQRAALEPAFTTRKVSSPREKRAIARVAAGLIGDGESVYLDVGTTVLEVARVLSGRQLSVVTNSVLAALATLHTPGSTVILLGGLLRRGDRSVSGSETLRGLASHYVDTAIIGAGGIQREKGLTDYHVEEAAVRREAIARASKVIAVADHTKFGMTGLAAVCPIDRIDYLVTDWGAPQETLAALRETGIKVLVAPDETTEA